MNEQKTATWRFAPLCGGTTQGFSCNDIEVHKGETLLEDLVREICQNSMDAKRSDNEPVTVAFCTKEINPNDFYAISSYRNCIDGCRNYWGDKADPRLNEFLNASEEALNKNHITLFAASDYGTTGLIGSHKKELATPWESLVFSDGVSSKNSADSAGSYGIGKNAALACSILGMVFYNTLDVDGESGFAGSSKLATLLDNNNLPTQKNGRYQINEDDFQQSHPIYEEDNEPLRELFHRDEFGTDVIIAGFYDTDEWEKRVAFSVVRNFFVAIAEKKLIVKIGSGKTEKIINCESLSDFILPLSSSDNLDENKTAQLYDAYCDVNPFKISVLSNEDVWIYAKIQADYNRTASFFRMNGMEIYRKGKRVVPYYSAVVIVKGQVLNRLLRDTEPASHDKWDYKKILDKSKRKEAKEALQRIEDQLSDYLKSLYGIETEEKTDAAGIGEYLPCNEDGKNLSKEEDALMPEVSIGNLYRTGIRQNSFKVYGEKKNSAEGLPNATVKRNTRDTNPDVRLNPSAWETHPEFSWKEDRKNNHPFFSDLDALRAIPVDASKGLYRIIVRPGRTIENAFVECRIYGENGNFDNVLANRFEYNGETFNTNSNKIGPVRLLADTYNTIYATLDTKGEAVLDVRITE